MPDDAALVEVHTRYAVWPGDGLVACWIYARGAADVILVADPEGEVVGYFEPYRFGMLRGVERP